MAVRFEHVLGLPPGLLRTDPGILQLARDVRGVGVPDLLEAAVRAVLEVAGLTESEYRSAYRRFADAGDAAEVLLANSSHRGAQGGISSPEGGGVSLAQVEDFFAQIAA